VGPLRASHAQRRWGRQRAWRSGSHTHAPCLPRCSGAVRRSALDEGVGPAAGGDVSHPPMPGSTSSGAPGGCEPPHRRVLRLTTANPDHRPSGVGPWSDAICGFAHVVLRALAHELRVQARDLVHPNDGKPPCLWDLRWRLAARMAGSQQRRQGTDAVDPSGNGWFARGFDRSQQAGAARTRGDAHRARSSARPTGRRPATTFTPTSS
jgi:hypothetical protein